MDKATRNAIERATQQARKLLDEDFSSQLEGTFDVLRSGAIASNGGAHLSARQQFQREKIIAAIAHKRVAGIAAAAAVTDYVRDAAFTTLNRFVALKMLEARDLVQECITKGEQSAGYREFCGMAPGVALLPDAAGYRLYIESLFDELSTEIKVLFDRRDPASLLWPRRATFEALLELLNAPDLVCIWGEDETVGWVYQYFNSSEERRAMRDVSQAPRTGRELAIRNQFFTPRYVVQFLTDNTLGRIWYDARRGETRIVQECEYLVRRPNEIFLSEGEPAPTGVDGNDIFPPEQTGRVRAPVFISFHACKDPRDIRVLDPACGSAHFLLYAFGLLLTIYEEAWTGSSDAAKSTATGRTLREDYPTTDALRLAIPELILRYNLHGIDIDARCAQIGALALWLRTQRAYSDFGVPRLSRPRIARTNIVVAEPMPGDEPLRQEFISALSAPLDQLVSRVFAVMELAGKAGSLLRIEDEIPAVIRNVYGAHGNLFDEIDEERWREGEQGLLLALQKYAESTGSADAYRRRLFAEDAARGFAFIDVCRQRYDVVLMNPPFGEFLDNLFDWLSAQYPDSKRDLGTVFVDRGLAFLRDRDTALGALISRKAFFVDTQAPWRRKVLRERSLAPVADLGHRVLDSALVEVAALVLVPTTGENLAVSLLADEDKMGALRSVVRDRMVDGRTYICRSIDLLQLPSAQFAYSASMELLSVFEEFDTLDPEAAACKKGLNTSNDERFLRLRWELTSGDDPSEAWVPLAKGGEYCPFFADLPLIVLWEGGRGQMAAYNLALGNEAQSRRGSRYYFVPALTYTERTASKLSVRILPAGSAFTGAGPGIVPSSLDILLPLLGLLNSRVFMGLYELCIGGGDSVSSGSAARHYTQGSLGSMPCPPPDVLRDQVPKQPVQRLVEMAIEAAAEEETCEFFDTALYSDVSGIDALQLRISERRDARFLDAMTQSHTVELAIRRVYGLHPGSHEALEPFVGRHPGEFSRREDIRERIAELYVLPEDALVDKVSELCGFPPYTAVKAYVWDRRYELICHALRVHPSVVVETRRRMRLLRVGAKDECVRNLLSVAFGHALGRSYWTGRRPTFESLLRARWEAPRTAAWQEGKILSDDPGHQHDVIARLEMALVEGLRCDVSIVQELEEELAKGGLNLRSWMRTKFFEQHLSRYSMFRRRAPIYWQLATPSASYSVWLFVHAFSNDTLYKVQNDFVAPKLVHEERKLESMRRELGENLKATERRSLAAQEAFVEELRVFLADVKRVAPLWKPRHEDGVMINFSPLWRLVPYHKGWQKELKATWDALCTGEYNWAHLAMHLWPERVVPRCAADRSLAIAHGLEDVFWIEGGDGKWKPRPSPTCRVEALVEERSSIAVKAALNELLEAPVANANGSRGRRRANAPPDAGVS